MPDLTISDLSFCELAPQKNLDKITGGETSVSVNAVSVSTYDTASSSGYAFVQVSRNYPSPEPVIDLNYSKLRELIINNFKKFKQIQTFSVFKFLD